MLNGYLSCESLGDGVILLFEEMRRSDFVSDSGTHACACLVALCRSKSQADMWFGLEVESHVVNTKASMYLKCRCLFDA